MSSEGNRRRATIAVAILLVGAPVVFLLVWLWTAIGQPIASVIGIFVRTERSRAAIPIHEHALRVRLEVRRDGQDDALDAIIRCSTARDHPDRAHFPKSWRPSVWQRLADGSALMVHLPANICLAWSEHWRDPNVFEHFGGAAALPADFHPSTSWMDHPTLPTVIEDYVSRRALISPLSPISMTRFSITPIDRAGTAAALARFRREDEVRLHHRPWEKPHKASRWGDVVQAEIEAHKKRQPPWKWTGMTLHGVPAEVWTQYPELVAILAKYGTESSAVRLTEDEAAKAAIHYADALQAVANPGLFSEGLPAADGRGGVMGCTTPRRPQVPRHRARYLPERCATPQDDLLIPVRCDEALKCVALLDRRGLILHGTQPRNAVSRYHDAVEIDGQSQALWYGDVRSRRAIVFVPRLGLLIRL